MTTPNCMPYVFGVSGALSAAAGTVYLPFGIGSSPLLSDKIRTPLVRAGVVAGMYVAQSAAPGKNNSTVYTIRITRAADGPKTPATKSILTCTISGETDVTANDLSHSIAVAPGDMLSVEAEGIGANIATADAVVAFELQY